MPCCGHSARTDAEVTTLSTLCSPEQLDDPNAVKVVTANNGRALYFSRATIPYQRGTPLPPRKHIGLYAYRKAALRRFAELPPSPLESVERLEQLRWLEEGISIHVAHTPFDTIGVDTEEDLLAAEQILLQRSAIGSMTRTGPQVHQRTRISWSFWRTLGGFQKARRRPGGIRIPGEKWATQPRFTDSSNKLTLPLPRRGRSLPR